jgi:predicted nucleic-acid-binding Zn-ribbon protein
MKSGTCPKCRSTDIYHSYVSIGGSEQHMWSQYYIQVEIGSRESTLVYLTHYVCGQCNHMETYVTDDGSMQNILRKWKPLNPPKAKNEE